MSCTITRLDHLDFNSGGVAVTAGASVYDASRGKVYFCYSNYDSATTTISETYAIYFREYDLVSGFAAPVGVETGANPATDRFDRPGLVRLTTGRLIMAYMAQNAIGDINYHSHARESTDNGLNWSARAGIDVLAGTSRQFYDMGTDGTNVVSFFHDEGTFFGVPPGKSLWASWRTGVGTWGAAQQVFVGATNNEVMRRADAKHTVYVKDANTALVVVHRAISGTDSRVSCFRTTDAGSTWNEIVIKDFANQLSIHNPIVRKGTDGRLRLAFTEDNSSALNGKPTLAYSDDHGATWTVIGTPVPCNLPGENTVWHGGAWNMNLGADNAIYLHHWRQLIAGWTYEIYTGGDTLTGWSLFHTCDVGATNIANVNGESVVAGSKYIAVCDPILTDGTVRYSLGILSETVPTGGGGAPPLVAASTTGQDSANIYLRNELRVNRGWSAHDLPVSSWMHWFEGDYTTQRRVPVLCASNPLMDPRMQNPAILPAIWKLDDPDRFTIEAFVENEDGSIAPAPYPVEFEWRSSEMDLTGDFASNALRAVILKYRRPTYPFDVEIWVDSKIAQVTTVQPAWPEPGQRFIPINAFANTGNRVQLRIKDRTDVALIIESWAPVYIPKRLRGAL